MLEFSIEKKTFFRISRYESSTATARQLMEPKRSSVNIDVNARLESFDDHAEPGYFNDVWSLSGGVEQQQNLQAVHLCLSMM